jgi:hypothetical protein
MARRREEPLSAPPCAAPRRDYRMQPPSLFALILRWVLFLGVVVGAYYLLDWIWYLLRWIWSLI